MMIMSEYMIQACALIAVIKRLYLFNLVFDGSFVSLLCVNMNTII